MTLRKLLAIILISFSVLSCKKLLETDPEFQIDGSTSFTKISDFESVLTGTYRLFRSTSYYSSFDGAANAYGLLPDMLGDNLDETSESLGNERVFSRWSYAADDQQIEAVWLAAYKIISQGNQITEKNIDKFAESNPGAVNRIKGQMLAIRGLVHFDLLRYWAEDYDRNSTKPGVPYITEFDYEVKPARGTVKETYDKIEQDLKMAKLLMSDMDMPINSGTSKAYLDSSGVNAILARMYLYANQLDSAIKYATYVINARPLATRAIFPTIWTDVSTSEVIWSYTFESGQGGPGQNVYSPSTNRSQYRPNPTLVSTYDQANDVRFTSYFAVVARGSGSRRVLSKYNAKAAQVTKPDGVVNFKVFRTGEMYLIRAEAYARKGAAFELMGLADLNALRTARISGYTPVVISGQALLDAIALERRKELVGEGHRFFDLKRTTRTINRTDCTSFCSLAPDNRAWTWPIPQAEIDANPAILPQNTGY